MDAPRDMMPMGTGTQLTETDNEKGTIFLNEAAVASGGPYSGLSERLQLSDL
ncbi:MAG: hypothetical protein H8E37_05110 [Planctomycetes bacterium]|nr:hypothetical protein [Planctomycetota bacterium]